MCAHFAMEIYAVKAKQLQTKNTYYLQLKNFFSRKKSSEISFFKHHFVKMTMRYIKRFSEVQSSASHIACSEATRYN
jgi:hypothetical protein